MVKDIHIRSTAHAPDKQLVERELLPSAYIHNTPQQWHRWFVTQERELLCVSIPLLCTVLWMHTGGGLSRPVHFGVLTTLHYEWFSWLWLHVWPDFHTYPYPWLSQFVYNCTHTLKFSRVYLYFCTSLPWIGVWWVHEPISWLLHYQADIFEQPCIVGTELPPTLTGGVPFAPPRA